MKKMLAILSITVAFFVGAVFAQPMKNNTNNMMNNMPRQKMMAAVSCSKADNDLRIAMRKLWEEHITYTRNYIISSLADLGDTDTVAQRLLKNQEDIGTAIVPYYGKDAGNKLTSLLKDHIMIATEVVKAAKMANNEELKKASDKWKMNAADLADFLSKANPNWNKGNLKGILYKHLDLTTGEVVSRLKKSWSNDIAFYDKGHEHMLMFADVLTDGIVKQFPDKFIK